MKQKQNKNTGFVCRAIGTLFEYNDAFVKRFAVKLRDCDQRRFKGAFSIYKIKTFKKYVYVFVVCVCVCQ